MAKKIKFKLELDNILRENLTPNAYRFWEALNEKIIPQKIWDRPTSSTGKHHKKENNRVPTIAEHTFEIVYATSKIYRMFGTKENYSRLNCILLAGAIHDALKYGRYGSFTHTDMRHDKVMADIVKLQATHFEKVMSKEDVNVLEQMVRFHMGRWGTDVLHEEAFSFIGMREETMFLHILDMLSSRNCLKTNVEV